MARASYFWIVWSGLPLLAATPGAVAEPSTAPAQATQPAAPATLPATATSPAEPSVSGTTLEANISTAPGDSARDPQASSFPPGLAVQSGDVIVFLGDELTEVSRHRNSYQYPTLVESFMTVRYPDVPLRFVNAGWSHDTSARALLRLQSDVLVHRPNVVVICMGLNDADYLPFDQGRLDAFQKNLTEMVQQCRHAGARVWLMTPASVEEDRGTRVRVTRDGRTSIADLAAIQYNTTLGRYAQAVREVAQATESGLADWYQTSTEGRARMQANADPAGYTRDGLNPLARGHALGAATLLKSWSAEPIFVRFEADWNELNVTLSSHGSSTGKPRLRVTSDDARELRYPDCPLPWPMSTGRFETLSSDWMAAEMCRFELLVKNAPHRGVVISRLEPSGREAAPATLSAGELDAGVNLATLPLLQTLDAVQQIYNDIGTKNLYHFTVWRRLKREPPREPELANAHNMLIDTWLAYEAGYEKLIGNRPKRFDLHLRLRENVKDERVPSQQPEQPPAGQIPPVPPPPPPASTQSAPAR